MVKYLFFGLLAVAFYSWVSDTLDKFILLLVVFLLGVVVGTLVPEKYPRIFSRSSRDAVEDIDNGEGRKHVRSNTSKPKYK